MKVKYRKKRRKNDIKKQQMQLKKEYIQKRKKE